MNILELLGKEINGKNWNLEEKARYLYLRSCDLFVYDPRVKFCKLIENGKELFNQIQNQVIDLEHVEDKWCICSSHTVYVFQNYCVNFYMQR